MTIPVSNRPAYQPGAGPPPPTEDERRELAELARAHSEVRADGVRATTMQRSGRIGCVLSVGFLGLLGASCGAFIALAIWGGGFTQAMLQMGDKVTADLRRVSTETNTLEANGPALETFDALRRRDAVTFPAFTIFYQRWADARQDQVLSPEELTQMMIVVRDINARGGSIDPGAYPEMR